MYDVHIDMVSQAPCGGTSLSIMVSTTEGLQREVSSCCEQIEFVYEVTFIRDKMRLFKIIPWNSFALLIFNYNLLHQK